MSLNYNTGLGADLGIISSTTDIDTYTMQKPNL